MRIAFFHELHKGGARRAANEFAKELRKIKNSVDLYIIDENDTQNERSFYDHIFYFPFFPKSWKGSDWKTRLYKDTIELVKLNSLHKHIAQKIDFQNYDVVLIFPSKFTQAPFILKFIKTNKFYFAMEPLRIIYDPKIIFPKDLDIFRFIYEKLNRLSRKYIDRINIAHAKKIIAPSKYSALFSEKIYKQKINVAYLGVNTSYFTNKNNLRDIDILYVGSTDPTDGYDLFTKIKSKLSKKIKIREVLFEKEWLNDKEIRSLYNQTKILIATSRNEPLGIIPLEAMACGVVTLAVNEAGYRETIINGKNGYLLNQSEKTFCDKINSLLNNNYNLKEMSENAAKIVKENWSWKTRTKELKDLLVNN